jgi:hypothetical protein
MLEEGKTGEYLSIKYYNLDPPQNLIVSSVVYYPPFSKISSKFIENFRSYRESKYKNMRKFIGKTGK